MFMYDIKTKIVILSFVSHKKKQNLTVLIVNTGDIMTSVKPLRDTVYIIWAYYIEYFEILLNYILLYSTIMFMSKTYVTILS